MKIRENKKVFFFSLKISFNRSSVFNIRILISASFPPSSIFLSRQIFSRTPGWETPVLSRTYNRIVRFSCGRRCCGRRRCWCITARCWTPVASWRDAKTVLRATVRWPLTSGDGCLTPTRTGNRYRVSASDRHSLSRAARLTLPDWPDLNPTRWGTRAWVSVRPVVDSLSDMWLTWSNVITDRKTMILWSLNNYCWMLLLLLSHAILRLESI